MVFFQYPLLNYLDLFTLVSVHQTVLHHLLYKNQEHSQKWNYSIHPQRAQLCLMLKLQVQTQCRCQIEQKKLEIRILLFSIGCQKLEVKCLRNLGKFYTGTYCYLSNNREAGLVNFSKNIHLTKLYGNTGCQNQKINKQ